ncbi:transporter substrate-binding domain-containing protein [Colidextribacter sp. 210702-DFI.3.9]|nr:transporter substrate-binding domain-containing protein [Colidextribacter sp. 210702-DFI.3.9]
MKKILAMAMAVVMALGLSACGGSNSAASSSAAGSVSGSASGSASNGDPAFTTVTPGKLTMSTNASFPPYEMVADDGSFEGIDIEVAGAIAEKLGLELQVDDMGFDAALQAAQTGKSDMVMAGVTITEERQAVMDFSNSYANGVQVVIVKEGSPIQTVDDLANANMIGCQMGTTGYTFCSDTPENGGFGEDHVTPYDDGAAAVQALMNGQIDAVVIDNKPAQEYVAANPGLKILDGEFTNEDYAIGVAKGNTALLDAINGALEELTNDGTIQSIVDKYISAN